MNGRTRKHKRTRIKAKGAKLSIKAHQKNRVHFKPRAREQEVKAKQETRPGNNRTSTRDGAQEKEAAVAMTLDGLKIQALGSKAGLLPLTIIVSTTIILAHPHINNNSGILTQPTPPIPGLLRAHHQVELQTADKHKHIVAMIAIELQPHQVLNRSCLMISSSKCSRCPFFAFFCTQKQHIHQWRGIAPCNSHWIVSISFRPPGLQFSVMLSPPFYGRCSLHLLHFMLILGGTLSQTCADNHVGSLCLSFFFSDQGD
jgi:hypothetical protein